MTNADVTQTATSTMRVIDSIQDLPAEQQVLALTASFKLMTERFNVAPQDAFTIADNIMNHADGRRIEFKGIQRYLENEI